MQIAAIAMNIHLLTSITLPAPLRLHTFSSSDFLSEEAIFSLPSSLCSLHIFIESLSGVGKAEKEIMMVPQRTVLRAKLLYFFPSFCIQTSLLIRLSGFLSQTSQFVNIWKHFHLTLCHSRNRCKQALWMKAPQTLCYQMWALGLGSLAFTNGNSYSAMSVCMCLVQKGFFKILFYSHH